MGRLPFLVTRSKLRNAKYVQRLWEKKIPEICQSVKGRKDYRKIRQSIADRYCKVFQSGIRKNLNLVICYRMETLNLPIDQGNITKLDNRLWGGKNQILSFCRMENNTRSINCTWEHIAKFAIGRMKNITKLVGCRKKSHKILQSFIVKIAKFIPRFHEKKILKFAHLLQEKNSKFFSRSQKNK